VVVLLETVLVFQVPLVPSNVNDEMKHDLLLSRV
jgi:hypothetical protein